MANDTKFKAKLQELKGRRKEWDEADLKEFAAWEIRMGDIMTKSDWQGHPITEEFLKQARKVFSDFNRRILMGVTGAEYEKLIDKRDSYLWIIQLLGADLKSEADALVSEVEAELAKPWDEFFEPAPKENQDEDH